GGGAPVLSCHSTIPSRPRNGQFTRAGDDAISDGRARHTTDSVRIAARTDADASSPTRAVAPQCFWMCSLSVDEARSSLARLSARFCFSDLPDFLLIVCRGDLSAIWTPSSWGPGWSRCLDPTSNRRGRPRISPNALWAGGKRPTSPREVELVRRQLLRLPAG